MLAFFCLGARYRPWRYSAAVRSRVFGDGAAPRRTPVARPSRARTLSFVLLMGRRSPSPAFGAVFMRGGRQLFGAGRIQASVHGKIFANAFSGDWQWQYTRAVRSRASIRGKFCAPCIPKAASDGKIASSRQDSRAMHPKTGWLWQDMRALHPKSPANRLSGTHRAKILPGRGAFRCTGPSNHARRADLAIRRGAKPPERPQPLCRRPAPNRPSARDPGTAEQCEPPELDRPAQETQPGRQRPRRLLGSKYRQQLPRRRHRSLPTPASSLSPRRTTLSSPTAPPVETASTPPPPRRFANLRSPKGRATFPACGACLLCSWQMRSAYKRQAEPLLRDYFVMVA